MSHFWMDPLPIGVDVDGEDQPVAFRWENKRYQVEWIAAEWREDHGWWLEHTWRHTYRVVTCGGLLVEIYHDLTAGAWYLQRVYD